MTGKLIYETVAAAFHAEGVRTLFSLTGDGNMHWEAALAALPGVRSIHVRHEHAACAMATAWARATDQVGVASVTCGPGLTQIMTALATAAQARIPLVVFAGEDPINAPWYNQRIDQAPLVTATGALYVAARSAKLTDHHVQEAFLLARSRRLPVVLGMPLDLQKQTAPEGSYTPSRAVMPDIGPRYPHPDQVAAAVARIAAARRVLVLGGRGAGAEAARAACIRLADLCDGALSETLPMRGLFHDQPRYIGVAGGFAHEVTREAFARADLVVAVGTSLTRHTSDLNTLFTPDQVIQIDDDPPVIRHGQVPARQHVVADAALALTAITDGLGAQRTGDWDVADYGGRVRSEPADTHPRPDGDSSLLDPRAVAVALSQHTPPTWAHVGAAGHCSYFATHIHGRGPHQFLTIREFGAIGNGLSYAIGQWAADPDRPVMLTEGDGGFLMHVQELETIMRYRMKILVCIFNDGAFGSEIHKLRADGVPDHGAIFGFGDLAAIARGFGLEGHVVTDLAQIPALARAFDDGDGPALWDIRVSDRIMAPTMRRQTSRAP
ncbi:thiamine pyrophosphate-binding protein [Rhodobacteraceae bacterium 2376]|uniref:Thiamine pyrophosphate-binding protein n=1 Tax=Rhabdonatronobacter sediminivivens TaxID=2743469 RepID=A0A7Z0I012_9RHOB|nr:thiamine pyrophosphate-binding protein [Rhabdonatronobacter sediminivivens]NYS25360.1 thiamine pyrophosphate-binding protein [Rhabdonatronobacter sediminivivens]